MRKLFFILITLSAMVSITHAQDSTAPLPLPPPVIPLPPNDLDPGNIPLPPEPEPEFVSEVHEEIPQATPPHQNIFFIADTSGSMVGTKVADAIQVILNISKSPLDEFQVAVISFGENFTRWDGTVDLDPDTGKQISHPGWSVMPIPKNLDLMKQWLVSHVDTGGTHVIPAIRDAFDTSLGIKDLSLIIISDCEFESLRMVKDIISQGQQARVKAGMPPASIGIFGIDVADEKRDHVVTDLGPILDIGFFRLVYVSKPVETPH